MRFLVCEQQQEWLVPLSFKQKVGCERLVLWCEKFSHKEEEAWAKEKRNTKYCSGWPTDSIPYKWVWDYFLSWNFPFLPCKVRVNFNLHALEDVHENILQKIYFCNSGKCVMCPFWSNREASGIFSSLGLYPSSEEAKCSLGITTALLPFSETERLLCVCLLSDTVSVVS